MDPLREYTRKKEALEFAMDRNMDWIVYIILRRCYKIRNSSDFEKFKMKKYKEQKQLEYQIDMKLTMQRLELMRHEDKRSLFGIVRYGPVIGLKNVEQILVLVAEYLMVDASNAIQN